jgi:hypothetical protein
MALLLLSAWASVTQAQTAATPLFGPQATAQAANPDAPVPAALYQSEFTGLTTGVEQTHVDWKKANADVGQFKMGYADLLKWEQAQAKSSAKDPATLDARLKAPLTAEAAVRFALLNQPDLQTQRDITQLSAQARKAWINAVASAQNARTLSDVKEAAEAGGELSRRMTQVGNFSQLQQAREQALLSDAAVQSARAQQAAFSAREKLIVLMGLWGTQTQFELPSQLPELPAQAQEIPDIESRALEKRGNGQRDGRLAAIKARSEAREVYHGYRTTYDVARHYQGEVVPLRKLINDEVVLRYNGMLLSVFDLLADTRAQGLSVSSATEALRDFWLAEADLQTVLAGGSPGTSSDTPAARASSSAASANALVAH